MQRCRSWLKDKKPNHSQLQSTGVKLHPPMTSGIRVHVMMGNKLGFWQIIDRIWMNLKCCIIAVVPGVTPYTPVSFPNGSVVPGQLVPGKPGKA